MRRSEKLLVFDTVGGRQNRQTGIGTQCVEICNFVRHADNGIGEPKKTAVEKRTEPGDRPAEEFGKIVAELGTEQRMRIEDNRHANTSETACDGRHHQALVVMPIDHIERLQLE